MSNDGLFIHSYSECFMNGCDRRDGVYEIGRVGNGGVDFVSRNAGLFVWRGVLDHG